MTRPLKVFEESVDTEKEPYPFALKVLNMRTNEVIRMEEFEAKAEPGTVADIAVTSIIQIIDGQQLVNLQGMLKFFKVVLIGDGYRRLDALINDPEVGIRTQMMQDVMNWLVEEYTGRPFGRSTMSSNGQPSIGETSTPSASSTTT